jgi:hypothetical protein
MRDNSGIDDLTKVNTETEFQPKCIFKVRSKCVKIFVKLREVLMNAIPFSPDIHHDKLPLDTFWKKIALVSNENQGDKNSFQGLKKSKIIAVEIKKILKKITNKYNASNDLAYDEYQDLIKEYCINKKLGENSKIEETLLWIYECYIVACMVENLEDPTYWKKLSPSDRRIYLDYGYYLTESREQYNNKYWKIVANSLLSQTRFWYLLKLSITYNVDFNKLLSYDRENLIKYTEKVFSYLDDNTYFFQESQIVSYIDPFEPAVPWEDWNVSE